MKRPFIHPRTPRKLKRVFRLSGYNQRMTARIIGVNPKYVHDLIKQGKEPRHTAVRVKMFLPKKPRQARTPKPERPLPPTYMRWWRTIGKENRHRIVRREWRNAEPG